ncbi:MAG TPA: hypothetical protein VGR72_02990 [Candidatus Acidoferrales bacterium]|nr:hypothetical protein [Candidatus Acidoferrales bacterium]
MHQSAAVQGTERPAEGGGAGGANDGGNRDFVDALNDALHDEAEIVAAFGEQACGVGVRIYRREVTKIVGTGEVGGIAPVEEIELDGGAVGLTSTGHYTCCQQRLARPFGCAQGK